MRERKGLKVEEGGGDAEVAISLANPSGHKELRDFPPHPTATTDREPSRAVSP